MILHVKRGLAKLRKPSTAKQIVHRRCNSKKTDITLLYDILDEQNEMTNGITSKYHILCTDYLISYRNERYLS